MRHKFTGRNNDTWGNYSSVGDYESAMDPNHCRPPQTMSEQHWSNPAFMT